MQIYEVAEHTLNESGAALEGKKATVWTAPGAMQGKDTLEQNGATFVSEEVVVDGNIITANGPEAAEEFGSRLIQVLQQ